MRHAMDEAVQAATEALRQVPRGPTRRWATVDSGGNPATVTVDGDDDSIEAQPTVGAVTSGDRVRVEFVDSGAVLIVGIR